MEFCCERADLRQKIYFATSTQECLTMDGILPLIIVLLTIGFSLSQKGLWDTFPVCKLFNKIS